MVIMVAVLVTALFISAIRMARIAKQQDFNPYAAFVISMLTTPMPLTLFFWIRYIIERYRTGGKDIDELPSLSSKMKHRNREQENSSTGDDI